MTSYYLSVGYCAFGVGSDNWPTLKDIFIQATKDSQRIKEEVEKCGVNETTFYYPISEKEYSLEECLRELAIDGVYYGFEEEEGDEKILFVTHNEGKHHIFRALIRIVIFEMHKLNLEVNVEVH